MVVLLLGQTSGPGQESKGVPKDYVVRTTRNRHSIRLDSNPLFTCLNPLDLHEKCYLVFLAEREAVCIASDACWSLREAYELSTIANRSNRGNPIPLVRVMKILSSWNCVQGECVCIE